MVNYTVRPPLARSKGKQKGAFVRFLMSIFPVKGDEVAEIIRKLVFIGAVVAFAITGGTLLKDVYSEAIQKYVVDEKIQDLKNPTGSGSLNLSAEEINNIKTEKPYIREELMALYSANSDLVGWINIGENDKIVDSPVVQASDNDKYLETDFYGNYSKSGTPFVDSRSVFSASGEAPNFLVLYGHNTWSSVAFSKLTRYYYEKDGEPGTDLTTSFYKKHPTINFDTLAGEGTYKVFAVCLFNTEESRGEVYNYLRRGKAFEDKDDFNNYVLDIMDRSVLLTDVDLTYGDEIICLSTCYFPWTLDEHNVRCAVFARKVREGESPEVDTSAVTRNYYWLGWQEAVDRGLVSTYAQRVWDTSKLLSY